MVSRLGNAHKGQQGIGQSHNLEEVVSGPILVLLSATVERFGVSRMRDFFSALFCALKMWWFSHSNIGRKRMTELISQLITKVFEEHPRLHQVC